MQTEVIAAKRDLQGKGASRRLRRAGKVPAVVYGGEKGAQAIELDHNSIFHQLRHEAFHASILTLNVDGSKESVLLRDFQMHPFRPIVMHVDFQRVDKDQKLHIKVPLHFVNADIAPGVKLSGGIVSHVLTEVDVACLPADLPEFIEVDLADLAAGHSIHLADLKLPKGVEIPALIRGENTPVATILAVRGGVEEETAGGEEAPAE